MVCAEASDDDVCLVWLVALLHARCCRGGVRVFALLFHALPTTTNNNNDNSSHHRTDDHDRPPHIPNTFLGHQGAQNIRRFLVNNILFVLLIHYRYPLIDQKTQNFLGPRILRAFACAYLELIWQRTSFGF
jgi:hypothetical protein